MAASQLLTEKRKQLLIMTKTKLMDSIKLTPMFWASLCKHGVVTAGDIGNIQRNGTASSDSQIDDLVNHVVRAITKRYIGFLTALTEVGQDHVVTQVLKEEVPETEGKVQAVTKEGVQQADPSAAGAQAAAGTPLNPWDKNHPEEVKPYNESQYKNILNDLRVNLVKDLKDEAMWPYLRTLGVVNRVDEEHIKFSRSRPRRVEELLNFIEMGPRWHFHSLLRAMALTGQSALIPEGGLDKAVYTQGCTSHHEGGVPLKLLSKDVLRVIRDHCHSYQTSLMRRHVFDFPGDAGDDIIDISSCIINVNPHMKDGSQMQPIGESEILEALHDKVSPRVIRLFGNPGDGKSSLMRNIAHHWSTQFPELIQNDQYITSEPLPWTTLVYLEARNINTTVEEAIRDALGCKEPDTEILMNHIRTGHRVGILMDAIDELRNKAAIEEVKRYVHQRKLKGGPTVLMSARTGICPIDAQDIDRFLMLQGFTEDQGIEYVEKYTKMYRLPDHAVNRYVVKHRKDLQPVLTNPLRLYVFSALTLRGEIKLDDEGQFNIPKLFHPLERYLLRRSGTNFTKQQSCDFYRMCFWGLLKGLRQFSDTDLAHFNISPAYHIFLQRSDERRSEDGELIPHYIFSHQMMWEYFAGCYIQTQSTEQKEAFLVAICRSEYLRNLQKVVFQILHQDWRANSKLIQLMVRCILALQASKSDNTRLCGLVKLRVEQDSAPEDKLYHDVQEVSTIDTSVCQQVNDAFDNSAELLREKVVFGDMKENGSIRHVVDCLQVCSHEQRKELLQETIFHLLPCRYTSLIYDRAYLQCGATRWGRVKDGGDYLTVRTCTPGDAAELLTQYVRTYHSSTSHPTWRGAGIYLHDKDYTLWGDPPACSWCKQEWGPLFNKLVGLQVKYLKLWVGDRTPLSGVLMYLLDQAAALHKMEITVRQGRIQLSDLVTLLPACHQAGLCLVLQFTLVVVPRDEEESTLRQQKDVLYQLRLPHPDRYGRDTMLRDTTWQTEDGQEYHWDSH